MSSRERISRLAQNDPIAREELVTSWVRNNETPQLEEGWLLVMEDLAECICQGNKARAHNLARLSIRSENQHVRQWAYGAAQAFPDFPLAIDVLLSLWRQEDVERLLRDTLKIISPTNASINRAAQEIQNQIDADILNTLVQTAQGDTEGAGPEDVQEITGVLGGVPTIEPPEEDLTRYPQPGELEHLPQLERMVNAIQPRRVVFPMFEIQSSPTVNLADIALRRFDLINGIDLKSLKENLPRAMIHALKEPQLLSDYTGEVDPIFIKKGVVQVEDGVLTLGPNVPIPPMPGWVLEEENGSYRASEDSSIDPVLLFQGEAG